MTIPPQTLAAYLDDTLGDVETARVERALRESSTLRDELRLLMQALDRGDHSLGGVWRRRRLTCPTRDELGSYLLGTLEPEHHAYIAFHLKTIDCAFCQANLSDLETQTTESAPPPRRRRVFESSAGMLPRGKRGS